MITTVPSGGRISGFRLASLLGAWRQDGRHGSTDLCAAVRLLVLDGRLPAGTQLPAERELAEALGVSRTMVTAALDLLRAGGLVGSRRGAGSWVTLPGAATRRAESDPAHRGELLDLARAAPEAPAGLVRALDAARLRLPVELSGHGYHLLGVRALRERIAERYTARGLPTDVDQILVTNGAHHAFVLTLRLFAGPGDRVLVEQPTYPNALDAIRSAHALPVPVALADDGWDLEGVEAALRQAAPRLAYLVVDFHNPTGLRLDAEGRDRLAAALRRTRTPAVVDETLVELDLEGDPLNGPPPLAAFAEDHVVTIGSASKSHWGGLRLGWVRASAEIIQRLTSARAAIDLGSPVFEQLILAELLADPGPALAVRRREFVTRLEVLLDAVANNCPQWTVKRPEGGLCLWCRLDAPVSTRLAVVAESFGLRLAPGSRFSAQGGLERWLRLPFSLPVDTLREATRRLGQVAAAVAGAAPVSVPVGPVPVT